MKPTRIRDIPQFKKALEEIQTVEQLTRALPFLGPFIKALGVDVQKIEDAFTQFTAAAEQMKIVSSIPDRFNHLLASRGWIVYDLMNLEVAQSVVERAETGDVEGAEQELIAYPSSVRSGGRL